jgi:hypothetical protein
MAVLRRGRAVAIPLKLLTSAARTRRAAAASGAAGALAGTIPHPAQTTNRLPSQRAGEWGRVAPGPDSRPGLPGRRGRAIAGPSGALVVDADHALSGPEASTREDIKSITSSCCKHQRI